VAWKKGGRHTSPRKEKNRRGVCICLGVLVRMFVDAYAAAYCYFHGPTSSQVRFLCTCVPDIHTVLHSPSRTIPNPDTQRSESTTVHANSDVVVAVSLPNDPQDATSRPALRHSSNVHARYSCTLLVCSRRVKIVVYGMRLLRSQFTSPIFYYLFSISPLFMFAGHFCLADVRSRRMFPDRFHSLT
jgi:hypothetical protein